MVVNFGFAWIQPCLPSQIFSRTLEWQLFILGRFYIKYSNIGRKIDMTKYLTNHQSANQWHTLHKLIHFLLFFVSIPVFSCLCFIRGAPFFCKNFVQWIDVCLVVVLPGAEVFVGGERGCILQDWCHWRWCSGFNATKDKTCCQKSKITPNLTQSYKYLATSSNSEDPMPWVDLSSSPSLFFHVFSHLLFRISISII